MNWKRLFLAALAGYIFLQLSDFVFHGSMMSQTYEALAQSGVFRPEAEMIQYTWLMLLTGIVFSFFFTFIFARGYEGKGISEGIRFGLYITLFWVFVNAFNSFAIYPLPYSLAWMWILIGFIQMIIMGIIVSLVYKPKSP